VLEVVARVESSVYVVVEQLAEFDCQLDLDVLKINTKTLREEFYFWLRSTTVILIEPAAASWSI